jgi:hypothetical protein
MLWRLSRDEDPDLPIGHSPGGGGGRIPFGLRIGVTGHRDLDDVGALSAAVRDLLGRIRERFPTSATTPVRVTVLSSLADGADQLVAREALDLPATSGVELHAVLPISLERYREDLANPERFEDLWRRASRRTQMPHVDRRAAAYDSAGRFIVDNSDVVIALWDGYPSAREGGTAKTVEYAREQKVCVLVVPTGRTNHPDRAPRSGPGGSDPWRGLAPAEEAFDFIAKYNERPASDPRFERALANGRARLSAVVAGSIRSEYEVVAAWALPHLVRANYLALRYQWWYKRLGEMLYLFAALAVTAVASQSQFGGATQLALLEVVFMLLILGMYLLAKCWRLQDRWLGYRSLAEAFRSGMFIALTGIAGRPAGVGDGVVELTTLAEAVELDDIRETWYQRAFSEAWSRRPSVEIDPSMAEALQRFLVDGWIQGQIDYHSDAVSRFRNARGRLTFALFVLFGVTIAAGVLHGFGLVDGGSWPHTLVFLAVALPGFGAALVGIRDLRQYAIHEHRSSRTAERLKRLKRERQSQSGLLAVRRLAKATQFVIDVESHDWSGVVEFQRLEIAI